MINQPYSAMSSAHSSERTSRTGRCRWRVGTTAPTPDRCRSSGTGVTGCGGCSSSKAFLVTTVQAFDVTAQLTGKSKKVFLKQDRVTAISPGMTITLTANGKTLTYLITGTTHTQTVTGGSKEVVSVGKNLLIVPAAGTHQEGLFYTTGNVNYALTPSGGEERLFSGPGQVVDVCALLAR